MFRAMVSKLLIALMLIPTLALADPIVTGSKPFTFIPGTVISSSQVNADFDYIINQVNTNAAKNGANSSITSLLGLTTPIAPAFGGSSTYVATAVGGTANAITITATQPAVSSYTLSNKNLVAFQAIAQNTGATTLNVNGTGIITIFKQTTNGLINLQNGDLLINNLYYVFYDGANYLLINNPQLFGQESNFAAAATVDIGLAQSHNVQIVGGAGPITSFGTSADANLPLYIVKFGLSVTLTHSATLVLPGTSNYTFSSGDAAVVEYVSAVGGWRVRDIWPRQPALSVGTVNGLTVTNNAGAPTTQIDASWVGRAILENTSGATITISASSCTINAATTGVNGLDTGALANNTWYYTYIISSGFGATPGCLLSTSPTAPTMPAGIVYKYRIGAVRTLGAATFIRFLQKGKRTQYVVTAGSTTPNLPIMATGPAGNPLTPTWVAVATGVYVPPIAPIIVGQLTQTSSTNYAIAAPNNAYGAIGSTANPAFVTADNAQNGNATPFEMVLESTNIFWAATSGAVITARGWIDAVNAN